MIRILLLSVFAFTLMPITWPVVEHCLPEVTAPSVDTEWTFPGAILLHGWAGIHAVQADWDTPHIAAFINPDARYLQPALFSPDQQWVASWTGRQYFRGTQTIEIYEGILVSSLEDVSETYFLDLDDLPEAEWPQLRWFDNETLLYNTEDGAAFLDPFTKSVIRENAEWLARPSPDRTRDIRVILDENNKNQWVVYNVEQGSFYAPFTEYWNTEQWMVWTPDSQYFMAITRHVDGRGGSLTLHDRNGAVVEHIYTFSNEQTVYERFHFPFEGIRALQTPAAWSNDGRYFAFTTNTYSAIQIVDMQERQVIDTCTPMGHSLAWSPDNTQLAFMLRANRDQEPVMVLDIESWALHVVAYHAGNVIGWRTD